MHSRVHTTILIIVDGKLVRSCGVISACTIIAMVIVVDVTQQVTSTAG